jgi:aspartyl/asparaginyl beta-hydroxylase (cupin superfamily)
MLKSDQQEKVPTTTPARSTAETILRRIPNNVNKEQQIHLRNLMDLNKQWSISDTTKLREKPNHKSLQSSTSPHVHLGPHQRHQTLPQQQTADSI